MGGWANKNQFGSAKLIFWGRGGGVCGGVAGGGGGCVHHVNPCLLDSSKTTSLVLLALARGSIHKHQFGSPKLILRRGSACLAASRRWLRLFLLGLAKARVTELFWGAGGLCRTSPS